jgi:hypothetical protein
MITVEYAQPPNQHQANTHLNALEELHDARELANVVTIVDANEVCVAEVTVAVQHRPAPVVIRFTHPIHLIHEPLHAMQVTGTQITNGNSSNGHRESMAQTDGPTNWRKLSPRAARVSRNPREFSLESNNGCQIQGTATRPATREATTKNSPTPTPISNCHLAGAHFQKLVVHYDDARVAACGSWCCQCARWCGLPPVQVQASACCVFSYHRRCRYAVEVPRTDVLAALISRFFVVVCGKLLSFPSIRMDSCM